MSYNIETLKQDLNSQNWAIRAKAQDYLNGRIYKPLKTDIASMAEGSSSLIKWLVILIFGFVIISTIMHEPKEYQAGEVNSMPQSEIVNPELPKD